MEIKQLCPICNSEHITTLVKKTGVPVINNTVCASREDAISFPVGDICLDVCCDCGFAWNSLFDENKIKYNGSYENNQSYSPFFVKHIDEVIELLPLTENDTLVEVGCGQGYFIKYVYKKLNGKIDFMFGFDPALHEEEEYDKKVYLYKGYLDSKKNPQVLDTTFAISRHVIEHINTPVAFVQGILNDLPNLKYLVLETPCLNWILDNKAYFDIYYEHCSLFSVNSLQALFKNVKMGSDIKVLFGKQYLLGIAEKGSSENLLPSISLGSEYEEKLNNFSLGLIEFVEAWKNKISSLKKQYKKIALWGGGSKSVTFADMLGDTVAELDAVIDINPNKQNGYLPKTGLQVWSPLNAKYNEIKAIIVVNPNYLNEIQQLCSNLSYEPILIPLESVK